MHKTKELLFLDSVKKTAEGQLLMKSVSLDLVADSDQQEKVTFPTGRGDAKGFCIYFLGDEADLAPVTFSVQINGNDINLDEPALAYAVDTLSFNNNMGTGRFAKTMIKIPEGAIITLNTSSGAIVNLLGVTLIFEAYLTDRFLPIDTNYNLVQYFEHQAAPGVFSDFDDILPAARGRIVGISLFCNNAPSDFTVNDLEATVEINGVSIVEEYNPQRFIYSQNIPRCNNWILNIPGGATIRSTFDNGNANRLNLGFFIYFSEKLESKRGRGIAKKQQAISTESVG